MTGEGEWFTSPCRPSALGLTARCLCAGPANASSVFGDQDLDALEAAWEETVRGLEGLVAVTYSIATVLAILPTILFLCHLAYVRLRGGGGVAEAASEAHGDGVLRAPPSPRPTRPPPRSLPS